MLTKRLPGVFRKLLLVSLMLSLGGCSGMLDSMDLKDETTLPPAYPADDPAPAKSNGAIYQTGHEISLYQDHVANRVGDILTVRLEESTVGQKQAKTKSTRSTITDTNQGTMTTKGGTTIKPYMLGGALSSLIFNTGAQTDFDGKGETNEFNKLRGTISVTITRVLSNGNLIVQGESWVTINQGREYVRLTGIVRTEDIDTSNVVSSQRLANARISYSGSGQVGNASRGGLITQLMYKFFPF
jgi:flagellar L-ring protein precursor FlgH